MKDARCDGVISAGGERELLAISDIRDPCFGSLEKRLDAAYASGIAAGKRVVFVSHGPPYNTALDACKTVRGSYSRDTQLTVIRANM